MQFVLCLIRVNKSIKIVHFDYTGLKRNGKSCRLRWVNYLRPELKRGQITPHEESIILELHARWGNRYVFFFFFVLFSLIFFLF